MNVKVVVSFVAVTLVILGGIVGWSWYNQEQVESGNLVSANGIHWHPKLRIFINGEEKEIPAGIGLSGGHQPVHTHDPDGVIHLEFGGAVEPGDITLGTFFENWGKRLTDQCIFDYCEDATSMLSMYVNGEKNEEYADYVLQKDDEIVLSYGTSTPSVVTGDAATTLPATSSDDGHAHESDTPKEHSHD